MQLSLLYYISFFSEMLSLLTAFCLSKSTLFLPLQLPVIIVSWAVSPVATTALLMVSLCVKLGLIAHLASNKNKNKTWKYLQHNFLICKRWRFSGKVTHNGSFFPLFPERVLSCWCISMKELSAQEPEFSWTQRPFFHEQLGRDSNCSRWEIFKNQGLTVLIE